MYFKYFEQIQQNKIQLFRERKVRTLWDDEKELCYFSIIDVIEILTDSNRPRKYWNDLKRKLQDVGSQLSEKIGQLKIRLELETGKSIVTSLNAKNIHKQIVSNTEEDTDNE